METLGSDGEMPDLGDTSESDLDPLEDDSLSAISGSEGDFEIEDLCWDHFGVLGSDPGDELEGSAASVSADSSPLNQTVEPVGGSKAVALKGVRFLGGAEGSAEELREQGAV